MPSMREPEVQYTVLGKGKKRFIKEKWVEVRMFSVVRTKKSKSSCRNQSQCIDLGRI